MKNKLILIALLLIVQLLFSQEPLKIVDDSIGRQGIYEFPNVVNLIIDDKHRGGIEVWETGMYINNKREGIFDNYTKTNKAGRLIAQNIYSHDTEIVSIYYLNNRIRTIIKWATNKKTEGYDSSVAYLMYKDEIVFFDKRGILKTRKHRKKDGGYEYTNY